MPDSKHEIDRIIVDTARLLGYTMGQNTYVGPKDAIALCRPDGTLFSIIDRNPSFSRVLISELRKDMSEVYGINFNNGGYANVV